MIDHPESTANHASIAPGADEVPVGQVEGSRDVGEDENSTEGPEVAVNLEYEREAARDEADETPVSTEEAASVDSASAADENAADENAADENAADENAADGPEPSAGPVAADFDEEEEDDDEDVQPLELHEEDEDSEELKKEWYILKVQVNREDSIADALQRRVKVAGLEEYFGEIIVPTEDVAEFNKSGKRRVVKRKLYPGYIMVNMAINDDSWFLVRETPGIGDFTGSAGKPTPMLSHEIDRILQSSKPDEETTGQIKTTIPFKPGDRVRVKEGNFQNFEGDVESIDEANGHVTVMISIFGRSTPVEFVHWQIEAV